MELRDEPARSNCVNTAVAAKSSVGWRPMLLKLSNDISECLAHAADARERANAGTDPALKANLLDMELRWQRLVESYRFVEQASRFLEDSHLARMPSPEKLPQTGVLVVTCPTTGKDFSTGILTDRASLTLTPQELTRSHCPHCDVEHFMADQDAKLVEALPPSKWVEFARAEAVKADAQRDKHLTFPAGFNHASVSSLLDVLVRTVIEKGKGEARAAFYVADGAKLHHVTGMPEAYARCVDGFAISPQSLACGLAAATGQPIITPDVAENRYGSRGCGSQRSLIIVPVGRFQSDFVRRNRWHFRDVFQEPREATEKRTRFRRHHNPRRRRRECHDHVPLSNDGCVQCPLLALSGHLPRAAQCPLSRVKRT